MPKECVVCENEFCDNVWCELTPGDKWDNNPTARIRFCLDCILLMEEKLTLVSKKRKVRGMKNKHIKSLKHDEIEINE